MQNFRVQAFIVGGAERWVRPGAGGAPAAHGRSQRPLIKAGVCGVSLGGSLSAPAEWFVSRAPACACGLGALTDQICPASRLRQVQGHTRCDAARPPCCGHRSSLRVWTAGRAHSCRRVDLGADRVQQLHRAPQRSLGAEGRDDEMRKQPFWRSRGNKVSHNAPCDVVSDGRPPKWAAARRLSTPHGEGARQLAFGRS